VQPTAQEGQAPLMSDYPIMRGSRPGDTHPTLRLVALTAVIAGVILVAVAAFLLSYEGIHQIALQAGVSPGLARLYPLMFDAMLIIACAATLALRNAGWAAKCYAWVSLLLLVGAVAAGDALHATGVKLTGQAARATIAIIPWALLLMGFGLWLVVLRQWRRTRATAAADGTVGGRAGQATAATAGAAAAGGAATWAAGRSAPPARAAAQRSGIDALLEPQVGRAPKRSAAAEAPAGSRAAAENQQGQARRAATPDEQQPGAAGGGPPAGTAPAGSTPASTTRAGSGPAGSGPAGSGPAGSGPAGSTPAGSTPAGSTRAGSTRAGSGPAGSTPAGSGRAGSGRAGSTPAGAAPAGATPGATPAGSAPAGGTPAGAGPAGPAGTGAGSTAAGGPVAGTDAELARARAAGPAGAAAAGAAAGRSAPDGGRDDAKNRPGTASASPDGGRDGTGDGPDAGKGAGADPPASAVSEGGGTFEDLPGPSRPRAPAGSATAGEDRATRGSGARAGTGDRRGPTPSGPMPAPIPDFPRVRSTPTPPQEPGAEGE
jgi:uncharacterized protein DUF2637